MSRNTRRRTDLYAQAQAFMDALRRREDDTAQDMLAAWTDAYWAIRQDLDTLTAQVNAARAAGVDVNLSWLNRQARYRTILRTARQQLAAYARRGAEATTAQQRAALQAALRDSRTLAGVAVASSLPGLAVTLNDTNPDLLARMVGFLQDGTTLQRHMERTLPTDGVERLRQVLGRGLVGGWGQDRMVRAFTDALAVVHSRAVTILRTESLRVYRETSRATYAANRDVLVGWTWWCALDRRSCVACVVMHGTHHTAEERLDGHPRCRCTMVPRTRSWQDLGVDRADTRPAVVTGATWLGAQSAAVQRAIMGDGKYRAWKAGDVSLEDMVARRDDPDWGTMRAERSLVAIREGRDANWNRSPE